MADALSGIWRRKRGVTRGAAQIQRGSSNNHNDADDEGSNDTNHHDVDIAGRSKEVEEDYFVTVNIEAPLETVIRLSPFYPIEEGSTFPNATAYSYFVDTRERRVADEPSNKVCISPGMDTLKYY